MSHRNKTYVIFDGDNDMRSYNLMKAWKSNENIDFNFYDAHDIKPLTDNASNETYIKKRLRERMENTKQVIVLVGNHTKKLYKYVRWEIELAIELDLPIIVVNLNKSKSIDNNLCPPILRNKNALHISFHQKIIKHSLDKFPSFYHRERDKTKNTDYYLREDVYKKLNL